MVFVDVHLGDANCFEIFKQVEVSSFVIFTTAYDQYALQAFKVNSVDYLLKPIQLKKVKEALSKYELYVGQSDSESPKSAIYKLLDVIQKKALPYKERFVVKVGVHIRLVNLEEIACFYSLEKASYLVTRDGRTYLVDFALDKLVELLDPTMFYRINRKYMVLSKKEWVIDFLYFSEYLKFDLYDE